MLKGMHDLKVKIRQYDVGSWFKSLPNGKGKEAYQMKTLMEDLSCINIGLAQSLSIFYDERIYGLAVISTKMIANGKLSLLKSASIKDNGVEKVLWKGTIQMT